MDHRRALMLYLDNGKIAPIAKVLTCSRQTLTSWAREGLPIEITGGKTWKEFRETERTRAMQLSQSRAAERATESSLEFFESAKADVKELFDNLRERLMSGEGEPNFSDVERLLNVFVRLDNQAADRVLWMQDVLRKVFQIVVGRVTDERLLLQIRGDLMGIGASETRKLGSIPGQNELPTPAEMVTLDSSDLASTEIATTKIAKSLITPSEPSSHS